MKKQIFLKLCFAFLLLSAFSMLVFGCMDKGESKIQTGKVEGKQLMKENSIYTNEVEVIRVDTSNSESPQLLSPVWHKELACAFYLVFK